MPQSSKKEETIDYRLNNGLMAKLTFKGEIYHFYVEGVLVEIESYICLEEAKKLFFDRYDGKRGLVNLAKEVSFYLKEKADTLESVQNQVSCLVDLQIKVHSALVEEASRKNMESDVLP